MPTLLQGRTCGCVMVFLAILGGSRAGAQEPVTLAARYEPQSKWFIRAATRFELDLSTEDPDGKPSSYSLVQTREEKYTREFLEVQDQVPAKQTLTYLVSRETVSRDPQLPAEGGRTELEDRVFLVTTQGDGQSVTCQNGTVSDKGLAQVQARERVTALLPAKPVAKDETWTVEGSDACRFLIESFSIIPDPESQIICQLKEVRQDGASSLAVVSVSINMKGKSRAENAGAAYALELGMSGEFLFNITAGRPQSLMLNGKLSVNGSKSSEAGEMLLKVNGAGNIKYELEFQ